MPGRMSNIIKHFALKTLGQPRVLKKSIFMFLLKVHLNVLKIYSIDRTVCNLPFPCSTAL